MIEHVWSVVCGRALVDQQTNTLSMIDVLEQIEINAPPPEQGEMGLAPIQLVVATLLRRAQLGTAETGELLLLVKGPEETTLFESTSIVKLGDRQRLRTFQMLSGLPIVGPGTYRFLVRLRSDETAEWENVASIPLEVVFAPETEQVGQVS